MLDLSAPPKAISEFNEATDSVAGPPLAGGRSSTCKKRLPSIPNSSSAHNYLGLAYQDADEPARAQAEFETAAALDDKFPGSFLNLGRLALSQNNFVAANTQLEKAASLRPSDPAILTALAYAATRQPPVSQAIVTVGKVHELKHPGMGNAHYVAAVSAVELKDYSAAQSEFALFLQEDPANPLAATARYNLDILDRSQKANAAVRSCLCSACGFGRGERASKPGKLRSAEDYSLRMLTSDVRDAGLRPLR